MSIGGKDEPTVRGQADYWREDATLLELGLANLNKIVDTAARARHPKERTR